MGQINKEKSDNTSVRRSTPQKLNKLSNQQVQKIQRKRLEELANRQSYIYDADKANYYKNLQDIYNYNAFGYGIEGTPTKFNPSTTLIQLLNIRTIYLNPLKLKLEVLS